MNLTFYTPIAYDYKYSLASILSYYEIADEIFLAIDKERISWSKNKYDFDETYFNEIKLIDKDKKIIILEDNFHSSDSPIQNDTNERNFITTFAKKGNFIIGIDSDEILLNSKQFQNWMSIVNTKDDISCFMSTVYKVFDNKILVTCPKESVRIGTNLINSYKNCRFTQKKSLMSPLNILHFSWGRVRKDMIEKLHNFGHSKDFNIEEYMKIWDSVSLENYTEKKNLHPLLRCKKNFWLNLELIDINNLQIEEKVLKKMKETL
jgi:hypothetical protein